MLKATQQVGQLKNEPRSAQASFLCPCQASFRVTAQVIVHTPSRNGVLSAGREVGVYKFCLMALES